jgi:DNA replication protein DnaC
MKIAQLEGTYPKLIRSLRKTDLLILDDWLRDSPSLVDAQFLLDVLDDRYSRMATLLVSQIPIADWHARIPDPTLADAILDRLVHNAHRIQLQGESQRKIRAERTMSST